jgi:hypothetical protein
MVLELGNIDAFGVMTATYFLITACLVVSSLIIALTDNSNKHSTATVICVWLAGTGVGMTTLALISIPMGLELGYPYNDTKVLYGGWLALAGFAILFTLSLATSLGGGASRT